MEKFYSQKKEGFRCALSRGYFPGEAVDGLLEVGILCDWFKVHIWLSLVMNYNQKQNWGGCQLLIKSCLFWPNRYRSYHLASWTVTRVRNLSILVSLVVYCIWEAGPVGSRWDRVGSWFPEQVVAGCKSKLYFYI